MTMSFHHRGRQPARRHRWIPTLVLLLVPFAATAARPRPIDCAKARSLQPGMTEQQVVRTMGKPYVIQVGRGYLRYDWIAPSSADRIDVQFEATAKKRKDHRVVAIAGMCDGQAIAQLTEDQRAGLGLAVLAKLPHSRNLPRRIAFNGTDFHLGYAAKDQGDGKRFVEYVPAGQNLSHWREMVAVYAHTDGSTPQQKLEEMEEMVKRMGNPHFKHLYSAADGSEAIAALPMLRDDSVEYQVVRWIAAQEGVRAAAYFIRSYTDDGLDRDAFVAREAGRANEYSEALKALSGIVPPEFGRSASVTITLTGEEDGQVWIDPSLPPAAAK